jgi:hypothetical protein
MYCERREYESEEEYLQRITDGFINSIYIFDTEDGQSLFAVYFSIFNDEPVSFEEMKQNL